MPQISPTLGGSRPLSGCMVHVLLQAFVSYIVPVLLRCKRKFCGCRTTHDVKATDMGGPMVRFKAEVDFDGREITRYYLEQQDLEKMLQVSCGCAVKYSETCTFV